MGATGLIVFSATITNGLRLKQNIYVLLGLLAIGAQIVLLFQPALFNLDNLVVFTTALLAAGIFLALTLRNKEQA